jgi:hypothetical protein
MSVIEILRQLSKLRASHTASHVLRTREGPKAYEFKGTNGFMLTFDMTVKRRSRAEGLFDELLTNLYMMQSEPSVSALAGSFDLSISTSTS